MTPERVLTSQPTGVSCARQGGSQGRLGQAWTPQEPPPPPRTGGICLLDGSRCIISGSQNTPPPRDFGDS